MATEIERKFLVKNITSELTDGVEPLLIRQGYLVLSQKRELRVRNMGEHYFLTSKQGHGMIREESEQEIDRAVFELLWPFTEGRRLEKNRFKVAQGDLTFEFDQYLGELAGLNVLEVEFESIDSANAFAMPVYCHKEITHDNRYKNASLAEKGLP